MDLAKSRLPSIVANTNDADVSMTEEQFNAAFFGAELVTV